MVSCGDLMDFSLKLSCFSGRKTLKRTTELQSQTGRCKLQQRRHLHQKVLSKLFSANLSKLIQQFPALKPTKLLAFQRILLWEPMGLFPLYVLFCKKLLSLTFRRLSLTMVTWSCPFPPKRGTKCEEITYIFGLEVRALIYVLQFFSW